MRTSRTAAPAAPDDASLDSLKLELLAHPAGGPDEHAELLAGHDAWQHAHPAVGAQVEPLGGNHVEQLVDAIEQRPFGDNDLADIAYTLQVGRDAMECRLAVMRIC